MGLRTLNVGFKVTGSNPKGHVTHLTFCNFDVAGINFHNYTICVSLSFQLLGFNMHLVETTQVMSSLVKYVSLTK